jgi:hypothetical protein
MMINSNDSEDIEVSFDQSASLTEAENTLNEEDLPAVFPLMANPHSGILSRSSSISPMVKFVGIFGFVASVLALSIGLSQLTVPIESGEGSDLLGTGPALINRLTYFGESSLNTYESCDDYTVDLEEAAALIVSATIDREAQLHFHSKWYCDTIRGGDGSCLENDNEVVDSPPVMAGDVGSAEMKGASSAGENSFGTNNQVAGVDEADLVKSDGEHVFAAYGGTLVVWDALTGLELSRTVLPRVDEDGIDVCPDTIKYENMTCYSQGYGFWIWQGFQSNRISGLLLHENRLIVITSNNYVLNGPTKALMGYRQTRLFIYDLTTIPNDKSALTLIARKDLQGEFKTGRSVNQYGYIVTSSPLNTWDDLNYPVSVWHPDIYDDNMTEDEYRTKANEVAASIVPKFAQKLANETMQDGKCSHIAKISVMMKPADTNSKDASIPWFTQNSVLSTLTQVYSIDLLENYAEPTNDVVPKVSISSSDIFLPVPSYTNNVYSSETRLVIAGESYIENDLGEWKEHTVFLTFELNGASTSLQSYGEVKGSLLNQFSMDHYVDPISNEDYLRVATTTWARWSLVDSEWQQTEESESIVTILRMPSSSSTDSTMEIVGELDNLGAGERLFACRFVGDRAYVVTFEQIDPFFTLDLSNVSNPVLKGELKIPGFSNYIHPVNEDLLLSVGQDADENGIQSGLQISMFNVSDIENPMRIHQYVETAWSWSEAQGEHKAFRYLSASKKLIIPLFTGKPYFDGFVVYDVDESRKISRLFEISHVLGDTDATGSTFCWSQDSLPPRSLVFNGNVTTLKGHTVLSTDLDSSQRTWILNLDGSLDAETTDNCFGWRGGPVAMVDGPMIEFEPLGGMD